MLKFLTSIFLLLFYGFRQDIEHIYRHFLKELCRKTAICLYVVRFGSYAASYKIAGFHSSAILVLYTISKDVLRGLW